MKIYLLLLPMMATCFSFAQYTPSSFSASNDYPYIAQEKVFVHYNTTLLFTGEYLYYSVYNLDSDTKKLSNISQIAYVELIDEDQNSIFKHKIRLKKGIGNSDFFIPVTIQSGNYKLIAYTQWMKNGDLDNFFQGDLAIINPYQSNQEKILRLKDSLGQQESRQTYSNELQLVPIYDEIAKSGFDQYTFNTRSKVRYSFHNNQDQDVNGAYSISVRRVDTISTPIRHTFKMEFSKLFRTKSKRNNKSSNRLYYPELRGELISGKVVSNDGVSKADGIEIAISIPENEGHELKIITTDKNGFFYVNLEKQYNGTQAILQVLGKNRHNFNISLDQNDSMVYPVMTFNRFGITPEMENMIVERSVHNQIENGYFNIKSDTLKPVQGITQPYEEIMTVYNLDDYTRFSTISETLVEVIELVWTRKNENGENTFYIKEHGYDQYLTPEFVPLIIVDGMLVQNHEHLLKYNARNVKSISFLRSKYVVGQKIFQGVLMIETIDMDYEPQDFGSHKINADLFKPEPDKKYYKQKYKDSTSFDTATTLDFRYQLLWEPSFVLSNEKKEVIFYTSDVPGEYELVVEGFTSNGNPVSIKERFIVK